MCITQYRVLLTIANWAQKSVSIAAYQSAIVTTSSAIQLGSPAFVYADIIRLKCNATRTFLLCRMYVSSFRYSIRICMFLGCLPKFRAFIAGNCPNIPCGSAPVIETNLIISTK